MSEDPVKVDQPTTPTTPKIKKVNYRLIAEIVLAVAMASALVWQNYQNSQQTQKLQDEIAQLKKANEQNPKSSQTNTEKQPNNPKPSPNPPADNYFKPSEGLIDNITAVFNTMNTQPMQGYMADLVQVYKDDDEDPEIYTDKTAATLSIDYVPAGQQPWNFRLSQADIARYKAKDDFKKFFQKGCLAGRSAHGLVVSLCFNPEGKIHTMLLCKDVLTFKPSDI